MSDLAIRRLSDERARLEPLGLSWHVIGNGTATIDLDASEREARASMRVRAVRQADDELLGARARVVIPDEGIPTVLLEPSTEGRLAAALAKFGPERVAVYLRPKLTEANVVAAAAQAGVPLSTLANGPFGRQRLVLGGSRWGPFVVIVEQAATIAP